MTRIECIDCGSELWGADERHGQCLRCQQREHQALEAYETNFDDEPESESNTNKQETKT